MVIRVGSVDGREPAAGSGGTVKAIAAELRAAVLHGSRAERGCYLVAAALFLSGIVHLCVLVTTGGSWSGPVSWRKPMTFGLSFGLTLATITWVLSFVAIRRRARSTLTTVFALACIIEVAVITTQAWRGLPSHFGPGGDGAASGLVAAAGAVAIIVTMLVATIAAWRGGRDTPPSMRLALRVGFLSLMAALAIGALMLARGMVLARGAGDVSGAFELTAGIKPGHAATMHGVLILPAMAWLLRFTDRSEDFRVSVVRAGCTGYLAFACVVVVESLTGIDPIAVTAAPVMATALMIAGVLMLVGAAAVTIHAVITTGPGAQTNRRDAYRRRR